MSWFLDTAHASLIDNIQSNVAQSARAVSGAASSSGGGIFETILWIICGIAGFFFVLWLVRFLYEIYSASRLVYMKVTLPRADSRLDKERETKKDFKEKLGVMSIFYKALHKMNQSNLSETIKNFVFNYAKVSLELAYQDGAVQFFVVAYKEHVPLIIQQITSNYSDAEVKVIDKKEYIEIKPAGSTLRVASIHKVHEGYFPIKTYKYFEDDPLSMFTNAFGGLTKDDRAVYQLILKPLDSSYNKKAKKVASLVSKGKYNKAWEDNPLVQLIQKVLPPIYWLVNTFINNESTADSLAPGASSGDAYRIFNQAEQEAQKMIGESAGQPGFEVSIRILVSSKTPQQAESGISNLITATNIFTDEYNNRLDNPQIMEDVIQFIITPIRYLAFQFKIMGLLQKVSTFSVDELTTMYHFPDINYNKSPMIRWLEYKMLAPPSNLKFPKEALQLNDYIRDEDGNVMTKDGTKLKVDKNKNLLRDDDKNFLATDGTLVPVYADGENKGKIMDSNKTPLQEAQGRML